MDLAGVVAELYACLPGDFIPRRAELAQAARAEGDRDLAKAVAALRKPTMAAWALNQLARRRPDLVAEVRDLGDQLAAAQAAFDGDRLRELGPARQRLLALVGTAAADVAEDLGHPAGPAVQAEIEQTLRASLADPATGAGLSSGTLASATTYAGVGLAGEGTLPALPRTPSALSGRLAQRAAAPDRRAASAPEQAAPEAPPGPTLAERVLAEAEAHAAQTGDALRRADAALVAAQAARDDAIRERDRLNRELAEVEGQIAAAGNGLRAAQREQRAAARRDQLAADALARARAKAAR